MNVQLSKSQIGLDGVPAAQLGCPTLFQLCQMAGEWDQLKQLARARGDVLSFAASVLHTGH